MSDSSKQSTSTGPIPPRCGIGLRAEHYQAVLMQRPEVGLLEVHSENYFVEGGRPLQVLDDLAATYPLSLHGVGLSLGSTDPLSEGHLQAVRRLVDRYQPALVSEHLSWTSINGRHLHNLLPLPYTEESLVHLCARVLRTQDYLGRQILIENPSSYLAFSHSTISEWEFIAAIAEATGCGILLDVNNVYVSARNLGFDAQQYLRGIPAHRVMEMHLAGHTVRDGADGEVLIDTHDRPVCEEVWSLYAQCSARFARVPTLIEWDSDLPPLAVLLDEAKHADRIVALGKETGHAIAA